MTKKAPGRKDSFGMWFQRGKSLVVGKYGSGSSKPTVYILNHKQDAEEASGEWPEAFNSQNLCPVMYFLSLPKQHPRLETKCSNPHACGRHSPSSHHRRAQGSSDWFTVDTSREPLSLQWGQVLVHRFRILTPVLKKKMFGFPVWNSRHPQDDHHL